MDIAFKAVLMCILGASVVSFVVMGIIQHRRVASMGAAAHRMNLLFSTQDPFDLVFRYDKLVLFQAGHSPHVSNVAHGRIDSLPVRAFDFRYEVGHGSSRTTRAYSVVMIETARPAQEFLLWNCGDMEYAPLACSGCVKVDGWLMCGDMDSARKSAGICGELARDALSVQCLAGAVVVFAPMAKASLCGDMISVARKMVDELQLA
jgi:hypothetical protein